MGNLQSPNVGNSQSRGSSLQSLGKDLNNGNASVSHGKAYDAPKAGVRTKAEDFSKVHPDFKK